MCTVTLVPAPGFVRIVCNRDERRERAAAMPPALCCAGERLVAMPVDPESRGTWFAVSDAGLAFVVLNVNPGRPQAQSGAESRGTVIPRLAFADSVDEAVSMACTTDWRDLAPFALLVTDRHWRAVVTWCDRGLATKIDRLRKPMLLTSSGLGDHVVRGPRTALFKELVLDSADPVAGQAHFHRHSWPERPELSVCMGRDDAATVSFTVADIAPGSVSLSYSEGRPDEPGMTHRLDLGLDRESPGARKVA